MKSHNTILGISVWEEMKFWKVYPPHQSSRMCKLTLDCLERSFSKSVSQDISPLRKNGFGAKMCAGPHFIFPTCEVRVSISILRALWSYAFQKPASQCSLTSELSFILMTFLSFFLGMPVTLHTEITTLKDLGAPALFLLLPVCCWMGKR